MQIIAAGLAVSDVIHASSLFHLVNPFSSAFFLFMFHLVSLSSFLSLYSIISHIFSPIFFLSFFLLPLFSRFLFASRFPSRFPLPFTLHYFLIPTLPTSFCSPAVRGRSMKD